MNQIRILQKLKYHRKKIEYYENLLLTWNDSTAEQLKVTPEENKQAEQICKANWYLPELVFSWVRKKWYTELRAKIAHHFRNKWYTLDRISIILWNTNHSSVVYLLKTYPQW